MKIVLADDHQLVIEGLKKCFEADPGFEIVGTAADGEELVELVGKLNPDVALIDVTMPGMNGLDAMRMIRKNPDVDTRCVILSMHREREFVNVAFKNGARGYVLKSTSFSELKRALVDVVEGKKYVSSKVADLLLDDMNELGGHREPLLSKLTPRERQTLQLLAEGLSVKEVGVKLGISHKTVHTFRASLMQKLECGSVAELTRVAIRHGLTNLD